MKVIKVILLSLLIISISRLNAQSSLEVVNIYSLPIYMTTTFTYSYKDVIKKCLQSQTDTLFNSFSIRDKILLQSVDSVLRKDKTIEPFIDPTKKKPKSSRYSCDARLVFELIYAKDTTYVSYGSTSIMSVNYLSFKRNERTFDLLKKFIPIGNH